MTISKVFLMRMKHKPMNAWPFGVCRVGAPLRSPQRPVELRFLSRGAASVVVVDGALVLGGRSQEMDGAASGPPGTSKEESMKERAMLWSPRMVAAIFNTRPGSDPAVAVDPEMPIKSETRRVVTVPASKLIAGENGSRTIPRMYCRGVLDSGVVSFQGPGIQLEVKAPVAVGDRLWGRETWAVSTAWNETKPRDLKPPRWCGHDDGLTVWYRADDSDCDRWLDLERGRWRPGRFMPRAFSRILHEVIAVELERLKEIPDDAFVREGFATSPGSSAEGFAAGWDALNGRRPGCSWSDNPWVWVFGLRRLDVPGYPTGPDGTGSNTGNPAHVR